MNSTSEGLALGVPLLVYPQSVEQAIIARRVQELGAGRTIGDRDATAEGIHAAASAVLVGPYRDAARLIARSFEQAGGAAAAADAVEELVAKPILADRPMAEIRDGQRPGNTTTGNSRKPQRVRRPRNRRVLRRNANSRKQPQGLGRHGKEGVVASSPTPGFGFPPCLGGASAS